MSGEQGDAAGAVELSALLGEGARERFVKSFLEEFDHWETPWSPEEAERVWAIFARLAEEIAASDAARSGGEPAGDEPRISLTPEERAQRLLDGREGWDAYLRDTGGGIGVCAVERHEAAAAPYAWISSSEDKASPYLVGLYSPERWEEALSMKQLGEAELEAYVFAELTRLERARAENA